ncbi:hypothetical protein C8J57DRAFT_1511701 [Mycena rebaudengoi]|nr:hypothetical protein C8J57DRAFT_1511701 [Mycena rebaudengoi]
MNHTIDDISPLLVYDAPALDRSLTGFDPSKLEDGTVTHVSATAHDSATISLNFAGTGVYVFVAYPSGHKDTAASAFLVQIDGVASGGWARGSFSDPLSGFLAYRNTTLSNGEHNFTIEIQPGWELYFDFLVYKNRPIWVVTWGNRTCMAATLRASDFPFECLKDLTVSQFCCSGFDFDLPSSIVLPGLYFCFSAFNLDLPSSIALPGLYFCCFGFDLDLPSSIVLNIHSSVIAE